MFMYSPTAFSSDNERQPLLQNQATSVRSHNLDDFYSPIDSPQGISSLKVHPEKMSLRYAFSLSEP